MHESEPVQEGLLAPGSEDAASKASKVIAYRPCIRLACAFLLGWDARNDAQFGAETMPGLPAFRAGENAAISSGEVDNSDADNSLCGIRLSQILYACARRPSRLNS